MTRMHASVGMPTSTPTGKTPGRTRRSSGAGTRTAVAVVTVLEGVTAVAALGGGGSMILDPAGAMGMDPQMLDRLPVDSWLLPGIALVVSNGVLPGLTAVAELRGRSWPRRFGHVLAGAVLVCWPVCETVLFGYPLEGEPVWLRPGVAGTGLAIVGLGLFLRRRV